ncbi:UNVERIFIED_CONTAM: hypothetical protein GTU68_063989 [Idotea baltica]|nr:hypothetical protein [Idotea baltica]
MATVTAALVKELRERTAAGMMECKKALVAAEGDIELAIENMRKSGAAKAAKKAGNVAAEGTIIIKEEAGVAALLEVNCQTDFVAKDAGFLAFANEVAEAALAASKPEYVNPSDVPADVVEKEKAVQVEIAMNEGKPQEIAEKMVIGRMKKFTGEVSLTGQAFIMEPKKTVADILKEKGASVTTFVRLEVGEGIEKAAEMSFADEVAAVQQG